MAVRFVTTPAVPENPMNDAVYRQRLEHAERVDATEEFEFEEISVEFGPVNPQTKKRETQAVKLKYALDSTYIFAVYGENPAFHRQGDDEWEAAAKKAIEKFTSLRNLQIKFGPTTEAGLRYNFMAELSKPIKQRASTVEREAIAKKARDILAAQRKEATEYDNLMKQAGLA